MVRKASVLSMVGRATKVVIIHLTFCFFQEFESKVSNQSENMGNLRSEVRTLQQELEHAKTSSVRLERDLEKAQRDKALAEQRMDEAARRMEEAEHKQTIGERNARLALEAAEKARAEATAEEKQKLETQRLAAERSAAVERIQRRCESLELERDELAQVVTFPDTACFGAYTNLSY